MEVQLTLFNIAYYHKTTIINLRLQQKRIREWLNAISQNRL